MTQLTASEVRTHLRQVLERVQQGEEIEITQNGRVVATLVHPERLHRRVHTPNTAAAQQLLAGLRADREGVPPPDTTSLSADYAEELVQDIRRQRAGQGE
ncbi:type II toxin-antitoxin system Phd/YefM family antitoxin [Deinococcus peraridilitoris]|uniref:Antitoxin n=1 Tax=Deinococcus peraridilitoris (strain DSM 19664 / LMG 22246 / CIP 109416 / KR-200) TaxID=937777 RepID=L0A381_DEIPD|nr:type II toxin-antitoxin system prevent-host-death family antitoxin [Deinococcus peraridilitoris]AFZ67470.1 prevent-host-death family protein [Deinococcus peraridilitoris DSM 19664]